MNSSSHEIKRQIPKHLVARILFFEDGFLPSEEAAASLVNAGAIVLGAVSTANQSLN